MAKITHTLLITEEEAMPKLKELVIIVKRLNETTDYWEKHFGAQARQQKEVWQGKAKQFIATYLKPVEEPGNDLA